MVGEIKVCASYPSLFLVGGISKFLTQRPTATGINGTPSHRVPSSSYPTTSKPSTTPSQIRKIPPTHPRKNSSRPAIYAPKSSPLASAATTTIARSACTTRAQKCSLSALPNRSVRGARSRGAERVLSERRRHRDCI